MHAHKPACIKRPRPLEGNGNTHHGQRLHNGIRCQELRLDPVGRDDWRQGRHHRADRDPDQPIDDLKGTKEIAHFLCPAGLRRILGELAIERRAKPEVEQRQDCHQRQEKTDQAVGFDTEKVDVDGNYHQRQQRRTSPAGNVGYDIAPDDGHRLVDLRLSAGISGTIPAHHCAWLAPCSGPSRALNVA